MENNEKQQQVKLELKPEIAKGSYSNLAIISHSHSEFIIDFATMLPGLTQPEVTNRIVMTPEHAKRLLAALNDNIMKYEQQYGNVAAENKGTFNLSDFGPLGGGSRS